MQHGAPKKLKCPYNPHKNLIGTILAATQAEAPSVIQIRGQDVLPATMGNRVIDALHQFESMLAQGALVTINFNRAKVRVLPIGKPDSPS